MNQIVLPIAPGQYVTIAGAFPLSERQWEQMIAVLQAMRPALVAESPAGGARPVLDGDKQD